MTQSRSINGALGVRQENGPTPIEYLVLFLVVVAGVLALLR